MGNHQDQEVQMKNYYIVTAARKDDGKAWRRYPVSGANIAEAAQIAQAGLDGLWEIIRITVLR